MFGYCHNDENRAFLPYAKHQQELEDIIECILETAVDGEENITISSYDDLSFNDIEYIEKEVYRRWYNE